MATDGNNNSHTSPEPAEGEVVSQPSAPVEQTEVEKRQTEISLKRAEAAATTKTSVLDPVSYAQMKNIAKDLIAGGAASPDAKTPEQLLVKLQAGHELGLTPIESLNSLYIVNGRVTLWGSALLKRLRVFGWSVQYKDESQDACTVIATKGEETIEDTFKYEDAKQSGYTHDSYGKIKVGWREGQNRKLKLRYGAISQLAKTYLPEVLGGITGLAEIEEDSDFDEVKKNDIAQKKLERQKRLAEDLK